MKTIELIDKYEVHQSKEGDYNPPSYIWRDNTGELIRCKDCEYFTPMSIYGHGICGVHCNGAGEPEVVSETYYCAWAERNDDADRDPD